MNLYDMLKKKKDGTESSELPNETVDSTSETNEVQPNEKTAVEDINAEAEGLSAEDKLKEEIAHLNDRFVRLYAEFDNFKRRTSKERVELLQTAGKDV